MSRTKITHDVFSAIGEPKRRALIEQLVLKEMSVSELVESVQWPQPVVSKHLRVLREVNLVKERKVGRFRLYQVRADELRPIQQWIHQFEKYWGGTLDSLDTYLTQLQANTNKK